MQKEINNAAKGRMPVRVLMDGLLARYETIAPGFLDEVLDEIQYRDFIDPAAMC